MKPTFRLVQAAGLLVTLLVSAGLFAGAAHAQQDAPGNDAAKEAYPAQELTPQILHQMMLAEVAAARGQTAMAARSYLDLARRTRDGRIARRAAEMALFSRESDLSSEAARLWLEIEPGSVQAQQLTSGTLASTARIDDLRAHLAEALTRQGDAIGPALLGLNRGLARIPDKPLIRRLVTELTEPYLNYPEAWFARANAAFVAGDGAAASEDLDGALRLRPDWEQAVVLKAQFEHEASPGSGMRTLQAYLEKHPDARESRITLARFLVAGKQFAPARAQFEQILTRQPDDKDAIHAAGLLAMQLGDGAGAEAHFRRLLDLGFAEEDSIRSYLGQIAEEAKRYDEAIGWYKSVTPGSRYVAAQARVAQIMVNRGQTAEARQYLQTLARDAAPAERQQFVLAEAQIARDAGRNEDAFNVLDEALRGDPESAELLYESALMAERIGRPEVMEGRLRKLIALKPDHAHAYNALGYSLVDRNLRLDEAEGLIRKGLEIAPNDAFILDSLGWALYRRGDLNGALAQLQRAFELRADPEIAAHLGEVLWMMGRRDEAARTWKDAAKANPDNTVLADVIKKFKP
ncbi:tetratricopeptide repeat protein [Zoogloea sp.]|uniref:tetratricopeptide repeat protein n=1 Tax=Zoogloea sp. TaxID=49181 RepID=UPI0025F2FF59|nr:tetratricopeptide repeat protein [Zoogloea sp.]MCK6373337.1 tetratricopeptide repeat protein [Zoogloea sp.]MCK6395036.1 tetratricopeptide repeat protein [Zoogloea sp.]